MTKTELIARQALKIERLELELAKYAPSNPEGAPDKPYSEYRYEPGGWDLLRRFPVAIVGDPRGRHPKKWEEIRRLQCQIADINAAGNREAKRQCDEVQAKIDKLWAEMQAA